MQTRNSVLTLLFLFVAIPISAPAAEKKCMGIDVAHFNPAAGVLFPPAR